MSRDCFGRLLATCGECNGVGELFDDENAENIEGTGKTCPYCYGDGYGDGTAGVRERNDGPEFDKYDDDERRRGL